MYLKAATLDDLLARVFDKLLKSKVRLKATKGDNVEISGVSLELTQPRARLSRTEVKGTIFSCLGEFLWYVSCSNTSSQIEYYISRYKDFAETDGTIWGAYGPRIFGGERSQYEIVIDTLRKKPTSRQAVIQLFDRTDIEEEHKDIPCTCTLQFLQRDGALHMIAHMRSNDAYWGLPHDIFAFTMIQEIVANELGYRLGSYKHLVGSLHLYDASRDEVGRFLSEGVQPTSAMPPMSPGRQWPDINEVFAAEALLRRQGISAVDTAIATAARLTPFWADMVRLLAIYALTKGSHGEPERLRPVVKLQNEMSSSYFRTYIRRRSRVIERKQEELNLSIAESPEHEESALAAS
ncbi:thymidylate synthase [Brevundimonas sp.]|uniref:thymidylate synthase n=1 Tax=Brevundimonas sp. TaxID=1871086 RepID=UPI0024894D4C|nr:thymidylate synthase [Brevundimonas sp.]MDI1281305.1 thymidylate synthase [Brevundimonas sp.]